MGKKYDFQKAKQIIEESKGSITEASLGMIEDWFWTAETVWEDGEFTQDLTEIEEIGGIPGSIWATPAIRLEFKDGKDELFNCYKGESSGSKPIGATLTSGPISSEVQANMPTAKEYAGKKNS